MKARPGPSAVMTALLVLVAAGCGSREGTGEGVGHPRPSAGPSTAATEPSPSPGPTDGLTGSAAPLAHVTPSRSASPEPAAAPGRPKVGAAPAATAAVTPAVAASGTPSPSPSTVARPGGGEPAEPAVSAPRGPLSPAVIASIGTFTGPIGGAFLPGLNTVQAWVADINGRGGLNGHPVQLLVYDNGGDPARHKADVREAVERKHIIAIVYLSEAFAGHGAAPYLEASRVPAIGGEGGSEWYDSPMYFPQASSGPAMYSTPVLSAAQQLLPEGTTRLGSLVCSEAANCGDAQKQWADEIPRAGFREAYRGKASVAQPDYTAECLAAHNAGAQALLLALDPSSISRLALSCARQGYRPTMVVPSSIGVDRFKDDPNLDGLVLSSNVFPYIENGTPASDEYHRVMSTYGGSVAPGVNSALGWVAAKVFEHAAAALPEPPTREAVLRGLWSLHGDTLGGLTQPLDFVQDRPAQPRSCWWNLRIRNKAWSSPDAFKLNCR